MKQNKKTYFLLALLLMTMPLLFAIENDNPPPPPEEGAPFPALPIDGGLIALFFAALFYGIKKSLKKNK